MKPLRIGIIGAGGIAAKMHLPELRELGDRCEVALVAGRKETRLQTLREQFPIAAQTTRYEDVIADESIDAVIVATPHPQHVKWGIAAIESGKHLLMQKPLCGEMSEADAFVATVEKSDRTVMVLPHFAPSLHAMRRAIDAGSIGRVSSARARTSHGGPEVYYREVREIFGEVEEEDGNFWFFDPAQASVGALFDMGVYAVSQIVALLGSVRRVCGATTTFDKPTPLEDGAALVFQMQSGALAVAETSWCDPGRTWELSVHGTAGKFVAPGASADVTHFVPLSYDSDHAPIEQRALAIDASLGSAHRHWLDCIAKGIQPPLSNAHAARHVTEVLLAGLEAGRSGYAIDIDSRATAN